MIFSMSMHGEIGGWESKMTLILGILLGLFVLGLLVVIHELGHAIVARRNGVVVEEFGIGFPPRAWKKKLKNGVLFTLNWLPIGGFVKLKGEHDSAKGEGSYGAASFWVKTKILLAGVLMNWVVAALLFTVLAIVGMPKLIDNQVRLPFDTRVESSPLMIAQVSQDSPAAKSGLKKGDEIVKIDQTAIKSASHLSETTKNHAGETVKVSYVRDGSAKQTTVTLNTLDQAKNGGFLGITSSQAVEKSYSTWSAPVMGVATAGQLTYETLSGVGTMLVKSVGGFAGQFVGSAEDKQAAKTDMAWVGENVAGPVGILGTLFPSVIGSGLEQIVLLTAIISLTLAVMNVLPIPALDGGRWFVMALFRLIKKPLTKEREENIQATGFLVLMLLVIMVTWNDIAKLF